ncbi:30S ribosomal protein S17 [bacterium HR34]|mgnify:CR=1 FL=1|nr:30S ribosomal protein S17 [bacterium HR34]
MPKKELIGEVVSTKMQKTLVVKVARVKVHPKYKKRIVVHKKYKAHYEEGNFKEGDKVLIRESRPISKDKKWVVVKKL